jgi:hypothetical protein
MATNNIFTEGQRLIKIMCDGSHLSRRVFKHLTIDISPLVGGGIGATLSLEFVARSPQEHESRKEKRKPTVDLDGRVGA